VTLSLPVMWITIRLCLSDSRAVDAVVLHPRRQRRARYCLYPWMTELPSLPILALNSGSSPTVATETLHGYALYVSLKCGGGGTLAPSVTLIGLPLLYTA
jgi:hypothetical protein